MSWENSRTLGSQWFIHVYTCPACPVQPRGQDKVPASQVQSGTNRGCIDQTGGLPATSWKPGPCFVGFPRGIADNPTQPIPTTFLPSPKVDKLTNSETKKHRASSCYFFASFTWTSDLHHSTVMGPSQFICQFQLVRWSHGKHLATVCNPKEIHENTGWQLESFTSQAAELSNHLPDLISRPIL